MELQRRCPFLRAVRGFVGPRTLAIPDASTPRTSVYLDKDANSLLWTSKAFSPQQLTRIRRRLCSPGFKSRPNVVLSQWLLSEMSSRLQDVRVEQQIAAELQLVTQLPSLLFLKAPQEVMLAEVQAAHSGAAPDVFLEPGCELPLDADEAWFEELALLHHDRARYADYHKAGQARVRAHWPDWRFLIKNLNREFRNNGEEAVEKFALRAMRSDRLILELPADERDWPKPQSLRSIWARASYAVMYAHMNEQERRKPQPNDFHDWCHFTAAAHADVFVTNDQWSRRVSERCPPPRPIVMRFEDWAQGVLSDGASASTPAVNDRVTTR